ncbi:MAG: hypothetical protein Kow0056_05660 [Coriobacteriia bacterium]
MNAPLPQHIALPAVGEEWGVEYVGTGGSRVSCRPRDGALRVSGRVGDPAACSEALRRWLRRRAHAEAQVLIPKLAGAHGLPSPERIRIGMQRSRWGSCSSKGTVSLNARLLFLPRRLAVSVVVHELCHLEHLNHSRDFYELLERVDPGHREALRALRSGSAYVPEWAM